ncbi:M56 family metallopeptidase [Dyella sp. RRB7]|uniref:M56 family metallopeptidase n=1 Tax=Dyella sp. RRB7 TaxID=2919502 RepID=UPI001FAAF754|nr:M56 family metallopeptidase [Dyella sp. RRB7]
MLAWMIYVIVVTIALSVAALVAEHAARRRQSPGRWVWAAALLASLLLPTIMASVSVQVPDLMKPATPSIPVVLRNATSVPLPAAIIDLGSDDAPLLPGHTHALWPRLWAASSAVLLAALCLSAVMLHRRKRRWKQAKLGGKPVLVTPDVGPAVVGLLRPKIVVPIWLMQAPVAQQQWVMAHEQSHLDAHDPQLLTLALCLLVVMPWNVPLWWQLLRLRRAIEVDCDARVLRGGGNIKAYCETLIDVGQNQSAYLGAVTAMSESKSFLEQRISIMLLKPTKWTRALATALVCLSIGMVAFAAQVSPPNAASPAIAHVGPLAGYAGNYKLNDLSVVKVTPDGTQLSVQLSGQSPVAFIPIGNATFAAKVVNAQISFVAEAQGQATALVLHQNGRDITASRVSDVVANQISAALAARVSAQQPFPGSDKALHRLLSEQDDATGMSPALAQARHEQKPQREIYLAKLGPMTSYEFAGVTNQGWDKYIVRHEHGTEEVLFMIDSTGTIVSASRHP